MWIMDVAPPPASVDVRIVTLNTTTTTVGNFTRALESGEWKERPLYEGYFHPFDGVIAKAGAEKLVGYVIWAFSLVPNWLFMIVVSFASRTFM